MGWFTQLNCPIFPASASQPRYTPERPEPAIRAVEPLLPPSQHNFLRRDDSIVPVTPGAHRGPTICSGGGYGGQAVRAVFPFQVSGFIPHPLVYNLRYLRELL